MAGKAGVGLVYKTSFDKANRTSMSGKRGLGLDKSLQIFADLRSQLGLPILTDVHEREQCAVVAEVVDILQIPAFLSRQTDLLLAAAATGKVVNVKKGQFSAPWDMKNAIDKVTGAGNANVVLTERGASFGYNTLVVDMTGLPEMAKFGAPIVMDATHAVQKPGGGGDKSGGNREMAPYIARAAVACGVAAVFMEVHEDPDHAPSDGPNMLRIETVPALLEQLVAIDAIVKRK
jgi:2-dehydro-3-deoxyphosphooctonate aldolase (KDO 8-P synthase)